MNSKQKNKIVKITTPTEALQALTNIDTGIKSFNPDDLIHIFSTR